MIVQVRRIGQKDWRGSFELRDGQLDFTGITDPSLKEQIEQAFATNETLIAPHIEVMRYPYFNELWRVHVVERMTTMWVVAACHIVLHNEYGIVCDYDLPASSGLSE